jgi:flagellar hook-associated protein 2
VATGTALSALGFSAGVRATGTDVAGSFTVAGRTEAATGSGQMLVGSSGNANTDGMQVLVTASGPVTADLSVTQGVASRLNGVLNKYVDPVNGRFKSLDNGFKATAEGIDKTIARQSELIAAKKETLLRQFAAMEAAVSKLRGLGNQLSALATVRPA